MQELQFCLPTFYLGQKQNLLLDLLHKGNFFFEGGMRTGDDHGHDHGDNHGDEDPDLYVGAGVSLELAWDGKLWLEPMIKLNMPGAEIGPESQNTLGLAWAFRYTF